jgi:acetyltransferase-like isoleucine patch superfamily enzyme
MLGRHIFRAMGTKVRIHHAVQFHFGYNVTIEDGVTVLRGATLDDRTDLLLKAGSTVRAFTTVRGAGQDHAVVEHEY